MDRNKKAILHTIIYSDIFDYPLTFEQLYRYLITPFPIGKEEVKDLLIQMESIKQKDAYYVLAGRENIISLRKEREKQSKKKLQKVTLTAKIISCIPTVLFAGISGGVAMNNADKDDDIDFFVITKKNTMWATRLCLLILLSILGVRRSLKTTKVENKICLNMFMDEQSLTFAKEKQDIYIAHEIIQVLPIVNRNDMYSKFLRANIWIKKFLPHFVPSKKSLYEENTIPVFHTIIGFFLSSFVCNALAKYIQMTKIMKHRTTEEISQTRLAFHPDDYRKKVKAVYNKRIKAYEAV